MSHLTRRDFIKTTTMAAFAFAAAGIPIGNKVFAASDCTVKTRYGTFNGFVDKQGVKTWLGIPFAQPPVGKLRWQAPQPLKPSDKTFDAKKFGFKAVQNYNEEGVSQLPESEDCLTLNIWTRGTGKNKPVMVFIHGGAFAFESASDPIYYGSNFAAANDVVLVSMDYRLNIFGFMNFGAIDSAFEDSGYLGMKDQVAALKWVKENIVVLPGAISINPLNWKRDETYASAAENLGGYIYNEKEGKLEIIPNAADAQVNLKRGVVITTTKAVAPVSYTTIFGPGSYHESDYALYYNNIKDNVAKRIAAYQRNTK